MTGRLLLLCLTLAWSQSCLGQQEIIARASALESQGQFTEASLLLSLGLERKDLSIDQRKNLAFELDRLRRIKLDFPLTKSQLFAELKKSVKDITEVEFDRWISEGRFESLNIDGERYFMAASVSNLFFRYPELYARHLPPRNSGAVERHHWETCIAIEKQALAENQPYVLPKRFQVNMTVRANPDAAPDGETIRAWLPIPRRYPFQSDFELDSASSAPKHIDDEQSPIRAVYMEENQHKGQPTDFKLQYHYTAKGVWFNPKPTLVQPLDANDPGLSRYLREDPHVRFSPELRQLAREIAGEESNPCLKAKKFYDWISDHIRYSFATEYSTIRNISEYCRSHGYGDCGQEALLFITLCRMNGIPARWQSGWNIFPGAKSNHDWTEIYLRPYGWMPVDPYMGIYAMRYATTLQPEQRREIRDFYFGGLDQYRMIANSDHSQILTPPKRTMRSDDVDFQRGELEWGEHNLYFDQFSYELTAKELSLPPGKVE